MHIPFTSSPTPSHPAAHVFLQCFSWCKQNLSRFLACLGLGIDCCPCKDVDKPTKWGRQKPPPIRKSLTVFFLSFSPISCPSGYKALQSCCPDNNQTRTQKPPKLASVPSPARALSGGPFCSLLEEGPW